MNKEKYNLLLADDDDDDCIFFKEALDDLDIPASLETVKDGVYLMEFLLHRHLPDILFLDLNMPRKSGFECLTEIKQMNTLKPLPVIIFSTSLDLAVIDFLYEKGALYCIQKPGEFSKLKKVIGDAIEVTTKNNYQQPIKDYFILTP